MTKSTLGTPSIVYGETLETLGTSLGLQEPRELRTQRYNIMISELAQELDSRIKN